MKSTLKKGFGRFVTSVKLPVSKDTFFQLESVFLDSQSVHNAEVNSSDVIINAKNYTQKLLLKIEKDFNTEKKEWLANARVNVRQPGQSAPLAFDAFEDVGDLEDLDFGTPPSFNGFGKK
jgi:hypothetical protein